MQRKQKGALGFNVYSEPSYPSIHHPTDNVLTHFHHRKRVGTIQIPPYRNASGAGTHRARARTNRSIKVHFFDLERTLEGYSSLGEGHPSLDVTSSV
ncbi:hypothetical protein MUK42_36624 [Musa troglodytarum]|uniref:Uncharacterized protein n=1 Tax=Musa troglodytarum TaxID=320322 RepID=A0A9E7FNL9_9LILI|nr:hypothetical protein MUK42_36624 [Musa troglodytarum]